MGLHNRALQCEIKVSRKKFVTILLYSSFSGYNFVTVSVFDSEEDRAYYVKQDPSHLELVEFLTDKLVKGPAVLDFVDGLANVNITSQDC